MRSWAVVFPKVKLSSPKATIVLVAVSNLAFMGHYAAWHYELIRHTQASVDQFPIALTLWFWGLIVLAGIELLISARGFLTGERTVAIVIGALMWLAQLITIRFLYVILEGD